MTLIQLSQGLTMGLLALPCTVTLVLQALQDSAVHHTLDGFKRSFLPFSGLPSLRPWMSFPIDIQLFLIFQPVSFSVFTFSNAFSGCWVIQGVLENLSQTKQNVILVSFRLYALWIFSTFSSSLTNVVAFGFIIKILRLFVLSPTYYYIDLFYCFKNI